MDLLKGYRFIAKKIQPTPPKRLSGTAGIHVQTIENGGGFRRKQLIHELSSSENYAPVPYRKSIATLALIEVLLGFVIIILQIISNGQASYKSHEKSFVRYVELGLFGSIVTVLAGASGFVVSREHMHPRARYHLFLFTFILTSWSVINDFLLAILHCGLISTDGRNSTLLDSNGTIISVASEVGYLAGLRDETEESARTAYNLKVALLVFFLTAAACLAPSTALLTHNLMAGYHNYCNPKRESMKRRSVMMKSVSQESDMDLAAAGLCNGRTNKIDCRTYPVHENYLPLLVALDS
ncbi:hypothetical protein BV898_08493 [Hypsibius exemplaris]|uniref:Uncharacterized protein n=1 Tax=Hypsibius exemplaris TaxID=2072580 RepID=A0A1W0WQA7_HYPEX|nr:hypothetical protein BV898_08493 [Hypsibius exemplaris]